MKLHCLLLLWVSIFIFSCSTGQKNRGSTQGSGVLRSKISPADLLKQACAPGAQVSGVNGVAWLKAKSSEASGQFPANIEARSPDRLRLEVETPFGGTYAVLTVQAGVYKVVVPGKPEQNREGRSSWGGIPLKWATELFLGRIPCLDPSERAAAKLSITDDDQLVVEGTEKFVYTFDLNSGKYSAKTLHWEKDGVGVDFEFSNPDTKTLSPLKWQAKSSQGEVKIQWRDREVIDSKPQVR